jgi:hypothetical protein
MRNRAQMRRRRFRRYLASFNPSAEPGVSPPTRAPGGTVVLPPALVASPASAIIACMTFPPIDYLIVGHLTKDLNPNGYTMGGTIAYSGLTASALGLRVGAVTSFGPDMHMTRLGDVWIHAVPASQTTHRHFGAVDRR